MQSFLERYLAGEHTTVWTELIELGAGVRFEPVLSDALAVARETMQRAYHNAELLLSRLHDLGYPFAEPDTALIPARPDAQKRIAEFGWGGFPMFGLLFDEEEVRAAYSWIQQETWEIWKDWYNFLHEGLLSF